MKFLFSRALQQLSDLRDEEIERHIVLSAVDHDIRESSRRLNVHVVHRFYGCQVLADNASQVSAALFHVTDDPS